MPDEQVSDRILTIPNLISLIRLLGVGVFWWLILVEKNIGLAAVFILVIGTTDWVDGYLARRLNQVSALGKALDPIADWLMIASAVIGGMIVDVVPLGIGITLMTREVFMGVVTLWLLSKGAGTLEVRYLGKVATFVIYAAIPAFYLAAAGFLEPLMTTVGWIGGAVGLIMYWVVAFQYVGDARQALAEVESAPSLEES